MKIKIATTIIIAIILSGCVSQIKQIPRESYYSGTDFTKYTNQGFMFTPEMYDGEYESIGLVRYTFVPKASYVTISSYTSSEGIVQEVHRWINEPIANANGTDSLFVMAKRLGADAVVNFRMNEVVRRHQLGGKLFDLTIPGVEYSGFAIRRKQK